MRKGRFAVAGVGVVATVALALGASATAKNVPNWMGGDSLMLTALVPNPERCGSPPVFEARLTGTGVDTVAGAFAVTASACFNLDTLRVTGLTATDRFTAGSAQGATITIESDDFTFEHNDDSNVIYSRRPVTFRATNGTGSLAGARGQGEYEIALSWPPSGGLPQPAHIWFRGDLQVP